MLRSKNVIGVRALVGLIFLVVAAASANAQYVFGKELEAVPPALRSSLSLRLQEFSEYERRREFEKQYAMFSEDALRASYLRTKEAYVRSRQDQYPLITGFKPLQSSYAAKQGISQIAGEATLQWADHITTDRLHIDATLRNGEWYLSEFMGTLEEIPGVELLETTMPALPNAPVPRKLRKP
ncbi:MAG TPA: hypothetical protein VFI24_20900 [Pyrinomonadaceae bacterium]|nr:hypothetical protein [Pyrinomonadaceae bacterium]